MPAGFQGEKVRLSPVMAARIQPRVPIPVNRTPIRGGHGTEIHTEGQAGILGCINGGIDAIFARAVDANVLIARIEQPEARVVRTTGSSKQPSINCHTFDASHTVDVLGALVINVGD